MLLKLISVVFLFISISSISVDSKGTRGSGVALASYYLSNETNLNLSFVAEVLHSRLVPFPTTNFSAILSYNKQVPDKDSIKAFTRINVPFPCECINNTFLGQVFNFPIRKGDTYQKIATEYYSNLTTVESLQHINNFPTTSIPDTATVNVLVNCSCGDAAISKDYGLFITYPLRPGETLNTVLTQTNLSSNYSELVQRYNRETNFSSGTGLVYIPGRDADDRFPPFKSSSGGNSGGVIAGISVAAIVVLLSLAVGLYVGFFRKKKVKGATLLSAASPGFSAQAGNVFGSKEAESTEAVAASPGLVGVTVDKSVEFTYEELAQATDNFSMANKIGEGGFGAVYYANLRGEEAAIKKMDMQASK